jgi:hypothetical protein
MIFPEPEQIRGSKISPEIKDTLDLIFAESAPE